MEADRDRYITLDTVEVKLAIFSPRSFASSNDLSLKAYTESKAK
jgi:hypothetical protein